jgi:hypothetical protein
LPGIAVFANVIAAVLQIGVFHNSLISSSLVLYKLSLFNFFATKGAAKNNFPILFLQTLLSLFAEYRNGEVIFQFTLARIFTGKITILHHHKLSPVHIHHFTAIGQAGFCVPKFEGVAFRQAFQLSDHFAGQQAGSTRQRACFAASRNMQGELKNPRAFCAAVNLHFGIVFNILPGDLAAEFSGKNHVSAAIGSLRAGYRGRSRNGYMGKETGW